MSTFRIQSISGVQSRYFTVLAVESSADDTCAAVVSSQRQILSNVVIKQHHLYVCVVVCGFLAASLVHRHEDFGGIHPTVAIEGHQRNMVSIW